MPLYLTEAQVEQISTMPDALVVVEAALRDLGQGKASNRPRQRIRVHDGTLQVMPAGLPARGYLGFKYYAAFPPKAHFWFHLLDARTGDLLAVMQADRLGQQRTGAASGIATKYLARADADTVGVIGTGWQAASQLEAICAVRTIRLVKCFSRDAPRRQTFAEKMSAQLGVEIRAVDSAQAAVRDAAILVTMTSAREPIVRGEWLASGTHINAAGANRAEARELDDAVIRRCAFVCADSREQARIEAGDLIEPIARGDLTWDQVHELSDLVVGVQPGRVHVDDVTLFKSLGIALEDVALGGWVYEQACARGIGTLIDL